MLLPRGSEANVVRRADEERKCRYASKSRRTSFGELRSHLSLWQASALEDVGEGAYDKVLRHFCDV